MAQLSPQKGEINLEKCFQLRIPRQFVANLEKGIPISLESGQTILPSDVLNADEPEKRFFIFESNANSVEMLEANPQVSDFLSRSVDWFKSYLLSSFFFLFIFVFRCHCIVHFTNDRLLKDEKYRSFIKKLNSSYHLVITESNPSLCLYSAHRFQTQLNFIDAKLFPMLREKASIDDEPSKDNVKVISCPTGLNFHLRPHPHEESSLLTLDRIPSFDLKNRESSLIYKDGTEREGLIETLDLLHQKQLSQNHNTLANTSLLSSYPEFVFLGNFWDMRREYLIMIFDTKLERWPNWRVSPKQAPLHRYLCPFETFLQYWWIFPLVSQFSLNVVKIRTANCCASMAKTRLAMSWSG